MKRSKVCIVLASMSTAALLAASCSSKSSSPATGPVTNPAPTVSPPPSNDAMTLSDRATPSASGPAGEATAEIVAPQRAITVSIGEVQFSATLVDTDAARAFADRLPLTMDMTDVNSNEKASELAAALPGQANNPGTIHNGELMLYGSNTMVLFYESFDTPYAYTRIGRLDAPDGLSEVLGPGDVTVTFAHP
jgi:hypothetical protein